jgi:hypothetical protein
MRVQVFSEVEWVEEYGRPRLLYLSASLKHFWLRITTLVFLFIGGGIGVYLVALSLIAATRYIWLGWLRF